MPNHNRVKTCPRQPYEQFRSSLSVAAILVALASLAPTSAKASGEIREHSRSQVEDDRTARDFRNVAGARNAILYPYEHDCREGPPVGRSSVAKQRNSNSGAAYFGFSLVPISATREHTIEGNRILLREGNQRVTLEIRANGWQPYDLWLYQTAVDPAGFSSGRRGALNYARFPCNTDDACRSAPLQGGGCDVGGWCGLYTSLYVDAWHPDYVFGELETILGMLENPGAPHYLGGFTFDSTDAVADPGVQRYAGTIVLDVSIDAAGTFTVGFVPESTFMLDRYEAVIPLSDLIPAVITIDPDCNANGVLDDEDVAAGNSGDCNNNMVPDECEDCNDNGLADSCDIDSGSSQDCNANGIPDDCIELEQDCNANMAPDACDIMTGLSTDCDGDGVPDECAGDCDNNGKLDTCELLEGGAMDCNTNGMPDTCDIAAGISEDCTANGTPDECERDCNSNGVADICEIADGTLPDPNGDGIADACFSGLSLVPVGASGDHHIDSNLIVLEDGGQTVTIDIQLAGWDTDIDGTPRLRIYQVDIDPRSFTSGQWGSISLTSSIPCVNDGDCFGASVCLSNGRCDAKASFYVDESHPNFVFLGLDTLSPINLQIPRLVSLLFDKALQVADQGVPKYGGTLILDVSPDASGTFTIDFEPIGTWMHSSMPCSLNSDCPDDLVCGPSVCALPDNTISAVITVVDDCNGNGVPDYQDISEDSRIDANGNGTPDVCDIAPRVTTEGSRYIAVTPADGNEVLALRITSTDYPCLDKYLDRDDISSAGRLVDKPVFRTPAEWGTVYVASPQIIPSTSYEVQAIQGSGLRSVQRSAKSGMWGDVIAPVDVVDFSDIAALVDCFMQSDGGPLLRWCDLFPQTPDATIDFSDVSSGIDAFTGLGYPFESPCP